MEFFRRRLTWALGGVLLVGLLLRLCNIAAEPYWGDEILSLDITTHFSSIGEMLRYLSVVEFHPPLYYILLFPWVRVFGTSEAATRGLSLLFSVASLPLVYAFAKALF